MKLHIFLLIVKPYATPLDTGRTILPIPITENVIEVDVVSTITNVSLGFSINGYIVSF